MTCSEVTIYLKQGIPRALTELPSTVREHLEGCECCRTMWDFLMRSQPPAQVSPGVRSKVESSIHKTLHPVNPLPGTTLLTLGFLLIFGLLSALFIGWSGTSGMTGLGWMQFAGMLGVVGAAAFLLALTLSREMVPGEKKLFTPPRLFVLLLVPLFIAVALLFPWEFSRSLVPHSWPCFRAGFMFSLPAAGLVVLLLRRGAVLSLGVVGAGAGLLAGLVGVVILHFGCGMHNAPHIALAHLGVPLVGAVVGGMIGRLLRRVRPWTDSNI